MDGRYHYVIGDVHGCLRELQALEAKIAAHARKAGAIPHIVSAGDLVDRGPDSAGVVRHLREGVAAGTHAVVLGNHEQMLLEILRECAPASLEAAGVTLPPELRDFSVLHREAKTAARELSLPAYRELRRANWIEGGGAATLASYGCPVDDLSRWHLPAEDLRFLASRPLLWESDAAVVTHALLSTAALSALRLHASGRGPQPTQDQSMSALWERALPAERLDPLKWHISGHSAAPRVRVQKRLGCVQVDSGCVFGHRLSAWCVESRQVLSVKSLR